MNYIGIDTSLTSTGVYILIDNKEYIFNYRNNNKSTKWHAKLNFIKYEDYNIIKLSDYSQNEIEKIKQYDIITDKIIGNITALCRPEDSEIWTEGFSYSSAAGKLIDLVCYATILRNKLIKLGFKLNVVAPSSLKKATCIRVYPHNIENKVYKNNRSVSGGKFKKQEMLEALYDSNINSIIKTYLIEDKTLLLKMKSIPSPISDIVDAFWLVWSSN